MPAEIVFLSNAKILLLGVEMMEYQCIFAFIVSAYLTFPAFVLNSSLFQKLFSIVLSASVTNVF